MKVEQLMTSVVYTVGPNDTLADAARIMWERDCGSVPVLDGTKLVGIITDRDCCMASLLNDQKLSSLRVTNHMSRNVFTVSPEDDVTTAEGVMRDRQIRRVPVVDRERKLRGIVSLADIARGVSGGKSKKGEKIQPQEVASTLSGISQERGYTPGASHA